jgi:CubicO group peptidase (beta-lactamase class C family)
MKLLRLFFLPLLLVTVTGCTKHARKKVFPVPEIIDDGWKVSDLTSQNIDVSEIIKADNVLKKDPSFVDIHTLTIARNGKLVFDEFYHPGPYDYHSGEPTTMQSVTKSFTSIMIGIAIDKGWITGVNQTAKSLLPNLQNVDWTSGKDKITIKHILTMSAGFAGNEDSDSLLPASFSRYMFSKPLIYAPGTTFDYRTALTNTLGDMLTTAILPLNTSLEKCMDSLLFKPLDITNYQWYYRSPSGEPELGGGLFLTPRDMAKLGQLVLDKGKWNGRQVVSEKWIDEATREYFHFNNRYWGELDGYGYLFWHRTLISNNGTFQAIIALGYGGQYVIVIPSLQAVIAITSWFPQDKNWQFPLRLVEDYILPAFH